MVAEKWEPCSLFMALRQQKILSTVAVYKSLWSFNHIMGVIDIKLCSFLVLGKSEDVGNLDSIVNFSFLFPCNERNDLGR